MSGLTRETASSCATFGLTSQAPACGALDGHDRDRLIGADEAPPPVELETEQAIYLIECGSPDPETALGRRIELEIALNVSRCSVYEPPDRFGGRRHVDMHHAQLGESIDDRVHHRLRGSNCARLT